jgi:hypothetical protein
MILNRARAIATSEAPYVSREKIASSSSRISLLSGTIEQLPIVILDEALNVFENLKRLGAICILSLKLRVKSSILQYVSRNVLQHLQITS